MSEHQIDEAASQDILDVVEDQTSALRFIPSSEATKDSQPASDPTDIVSIEDLRNQYEKCIQEYEAITDSVERQDSPAFQERIRNLIKSFDKCLLGVKRLDVLSQNESLDDINTEDLNFVLLDYYRAKTILRKQGKTHDPAERVVFVKEAVAVLESFLTSCDAHGVVGRLFPKSDIDELILLPKVTREEKIERLKCAMEIKKKLDAVTGPNSSTSGNQLDESVVREKRLLTIDHTVYAALEDLNSATQEVELLERFSGMNLGQTPPAPPQEPPPSKGLTVTHISKDGIETRETIKANVFKQSWRSPTMSLDEYAEIEMQQAIEREARDASADTLDKKYETLVEEGLEDDHELVDKATYRDRGWDDYKDDNPKGSGVTNRF